MEEGGAEALVQRSQLSMKLQLTSPNSPPAEMLTPFQKVVSCREIHISQIVNMNLDSSFFKYTSQKNTCLTISHSKTALSHHRKREWGLALGRECVSAEWWNAAAAWGKVHHPSWWVAVLTMRTPLPIRVHVHEISL